MLADRLQASVVTLFHNRGKQLTTRFPSLSPRCGLFPPYHSKHYRPGAHGTRGQMWKTHLYSNESERVFPLYLKKNFIIS
jgi:hypothetical protein